MSDEQWYWYLTHQTAEKGPGCRAQERMGPYPTAEAARNWKSSHEERADEWQEDDEEWEG